METRLICSDDAARLTALHADSFGVARWSLQQMTDSLALPTNLGFVTEANQDLLGFILCQIIADEAEILTFCTAPSARRQGIGTALLQITIQAAQLRNVHKIFLEVAADNHAAQNLYKKNGFRVTGIRKGYYAREGHKMDALLLTWEKS